jgi:hypothetical protein
MKEAFAALGPRGRAAVVTLVAMRLADDIRVAGDDDRAATAAIDAMKRWVRGERVSGRKMSDLVYNEDNGAAEGIALHTMIGAETDATPAWLALTTAVMYVAWHVYRSTSETMPGDVAEVDEDTLDMLDEYWRATSSYDRGLIEYAARSLSGKPDSTIDVDEIASDLRRR